MTIYELKSFIEEVDDNTDITVGNFKSIRRTSKESLKRDKKRAVGNSSLVFGWGNDNKAARLSRNIKLIIEKNNPLIDEDLIFGSFDLGYEEIVRPLINDKGEIYFLTKEI